MADLVCEIDRRIMRDHWQFAGVTLDTQLLRSAMNGKTRQNPFLSPFTSTEHELIHSRIHYARDKPQCKTCYERNEHDG
jgi:hypothetical protein